MKRSIFALSLLLMVGCAVQKTEVKTASFDEQLHKPAADYSAGSIWQASSGGVTEDFKARHRGDIITIVISEVASASKQASTATDRSSAIHAEMPNFMGLERHKQFSAIFGDLNNLINAKGDSKFNGSGSTSRQENLTATISAKVIDVLPNGNLLLEGRRNVKVNNEDQEIILQGVIRPRDIGTDNTVNSIYVADAKISYSGKGIISDRQSPGWLMNIIDKIWPF
ncbi:MAG TPA: flagellar basal body L-ring protein FlgH [Desulfuromonadaceae bacterium]